MSSDTEIKIWDLIQKKQITNLYTHINHVKSIGLHKSAKYIALNCFNNKCVVLKIKITEKSKNDIRKRFKKSSSLSIPDCKSQTFKGSDFKDHEILEKYRNLPNDYKSLIEFAIVFNRREYAILGYVDGRILLLNLEEESKTFFLPGHKNQIVAVAVSVDRNFIASSCKDNFLRVWDLKAQKQISETCWDKTKCLLFYNSSYPTEKDSLAFTSDNKFIIGFSKNVIMIWDFTNLRLRLRNEFDMNIIFADITPNNEKLIVYAGKFYLLDLKTFTFSNCEEANLLNRVYKKITNDSKYAIIGNSIFLGFWNLKSGNVLSFLVPEIKFLALIQEGNSLLCSSSYSTSIYNKSSKSIETLYSESNVSNSFTLSLDTNIFVTASQNSISIYNLKTTKKISNFPGPFYANPILVSISSNNKFLICSLKGGTLTLINLSTYKFDNFLTTFIDVPLGLILSHSNKFAITFSNKGIIKFWNVDEKVVEAEIFKGHEEINCFSISANDEYIVTGGYMNIGNCVSVWDLRNKDLKGRLRGHNGKINVIVVSENIKFIVSGSDDKTIIVWNLFKMQKEFMLEGHINKVKSIAIDRNFEWAYSASQGGTIRVWNLSKQEESKKIIRLHEKELIKLWKKYPELEPYHEWSCNDS
ncbi:hypothetical protein SteCoe_21759 [Stentor coeruleus]|uniref:Anaphase-promoting complex subunit 4 WD40 domain-containing protein n=1 Tax=Stentor coeruleus TaxID=5963 RepID=A0A1R2BPC9_9CILI|nr:hypothetical protein SteCoe_21759 [Stentor coeruleus]